MKLKVDPQDLKEKHQKQTPDGIDQAVSTREITFDMFKPEVQEAIRAVGEGVFHAWDGKTCNNILSPKPPRKFMRLTCHEDGRRNMWESQLEENPKYHDSGPTIETAVSALLLTLKCFDMSGNRDDYDVILHKA